MPIDSEKNGTISTPINYTNSWYQEWKGTQSQRKFKNMEMIVFHQIEMRNWISRFKTIFKKSIIFVKLSQNES
jgi:hypothetical protein